MKQFKAKSKKVLDLMINSIYTNKDVFLRELISNASDANDKLYYKSLKENLGFTKADFKISIERDEANHVLTIIDNGIGMDDHDLENNLGTIANSDSELFKKLEDTPEDINIIGQFGVGFYSAFMVCKRIEVETKKYGDEMGYLWTSEGMDGFSIKEMPVAEVGTTIRLFLKDDTEDENYSKYVSEQEVKDLISKYSNYIRYPIVMNVAKTRDVKGKKDQQETYFEEETLNSMIPLWHKAKKEITEAELNDFYKNDLRNYDDPLLSQVIKLEGGMTDYTALIFIPKEAPYDYYYKSFKKGLKLFSRGVMIDEKCEALLADHFSFVTGILEADLPLNISRETIQQNHELKKINRSLDGKIKGILDNLLKDNRPNYELFFKAFGVRLKHSLYEQFYNEDLKKELINLILLFSLKEDKLVTFKEYLEKTSEDKNIYYIKADQKEHALEIPQVKALLKDKDVLLLTDDVDEFLLKMLGKYQDSEFKDAISNQSIQENLELTTEDQELLTFAKEALGDQVKDVKFSALLEDYPSYLISGEGLSIEMEKVLNKLPNHEERAKSDKILSINYTHPIRNRLEALIKTDPELTKRYLNLLFELAKFNAGLPVDAPTKLSKEIFELLTM